MDTTPAAWVLLGQVLKAQQKLEEARHACSQALGSDPNYLPADLCLADLSAIEQRWEEILRYASAAVALDPVNDPHGCHTFGRSHPLPLIRDPARNGSR
jgi:tetratricopeptide (TPR) repeat protein